MTNTTPTSPLLLSIVVPCYNEAEGLAELCCRVEAVSVDVVGPAYELILVNDGSTDDTLDVLHSLARTLPNLVVVNLSRNHGHQLALSAGLSVSSGARVFILDADLQDPPELLAQMMLQMDQNKADVVFGQRIARKGESLFKRITAKLFYKFFGKLADTKVPADTGDFRLMSRRATDLLANMPEASRYLRGMISWIGLKQIAFPYVRQPRQTGHSKYPLRKMIHFALEAITSFSIVPLRLASYTGALFGIIGLGLMAYVMRAWLAGETVQGWTSLMVVVLVLGSVQLLCLGVFGEYLGRLYMESKRRPLFIIESITRSDNT
ncbi:MAG: glycosyltransferase family 2 protein [Alphaproteobacteria bacterium]|nr:glycosyltransferase family 2 protein [Alphaproteobacteria bacterium]